MTRAHHLPLFHPRLVRERAKSIDAALFRARPSKLRSDSSVDGALGFFSSDKRQARVIAPGLVAGRAEILVRERSLAAQVHAAYGLSAEDLALLAQTAPPRMPPGFAA